MLPGHDLFVTLDDAPVVGGQGVVRLAGVGFDRARRDTIDCWEDWP